MEYKWSNIGWSQYQITDSTGSVLNNTRYNRALSGSFSNLTAVHNAIVYLEPRWQAVGITLPSIKRDGYDFQGWYKGNSYVGNSGEVKSFTVNTTLSPKWSSVYRVTTDKIQISSGNNIHNKNGVYYVKADGSSIITLTHNSKIIDGGAKLNYQINGIKYIVNNLNNSTNCELIQTFSNQTNLSNNAIVNNNLVLSGTSIINQSGVVVNTYSSNCSNINTVGKFTINNNLDGHKIEIYPRAYAVTKDDRTPFNNYSDINSDKNNKITLIADATAPVISGVDEFISEISKYNSNIDKDLYSVSLKIKAVDSLSGVRSLTVYVNNLDDNKFNKVFTGQVNGEEASITININDLNNIDLFNGCNEIIVESVDNVGNISTRTAYSTEFTLNTKLSNVKLPDIESESYKKGDVVLIKNQVTGYTDKLEIIVPKELSVNNQEIVYTHEFNPRSPLNVVEDYLIIPLEAEDNQYTIKIFAYKDKNKNGIYEAELGEILNYNPDIKVFTASGSIVDDWQNNLE